MTPQATAGSQRLEDIEVHLLLEGIALHYGYDFRDYAPALVRRSIAMSMAVEGIGSISRYQDRLLHDPDSLERFLNAVSADSPTFFREPEPLRYVRDEIAPWLRTFPSARIWVAGCATGEEVVSLAIVLHESGVLARTRIYATDISERSLRIARMGRYPFENVVACDAAYSRSGGTASLPDYCTVSGDVARFDGALLANVTWARHNVVTDASFNEFHVVVCTGLLTHFSTALQQRVHRLLHESLVPHGYLIVGSSSASADARRDGFEEIAGQPNVFRRARR